MSMCSKMLHLNHVFSFNPKVTLNPNHLVEVLRHIVRTHTAPKACRKWKIAYDQQYIKDENGDLRFRTIESTVCHRVLIMDLAPSHMSIAAQQYAEEHWIH